MAETEGPSVIVFNDLTPKVPGVPQVSITRGCQIWHSGTPLHPLRRNGLKPLPPTGAFGIPRHTLRSPKSMRPALMKALSMIRVLALVAIGIAILSVALNGGIGGSGMRF